MNLFSKGNNIGIKDNIQNNKILKRLLQFVIGVFCVAFSYNTFISPNNLVPGGVGGIAIILDKLFGLDNSVIILFLNIILLLLSLILLGKKQTKASLLGSILFPFFVMLTENINVWFKVDESHTLLSAIYGGIIFGFGAGLIFKAGFTTGGTDIINQIISKYLKISIGKSMLLSDGLIVLSSAIFFGINTLMYSVIMLYIISIMSDKVILGISDSKSFFIITAKEEEVENFILNDLKHGATIYKAKGGYKRQNEKVLMTVLPTKEYFNLTEGIKKIDPEAFYIITDTYEVFGGE